MDGLDTISDLELAVLAEEMNSELADSIKLQSGLLFIATKEAAERTSVMLAELIGRFKEKLIHQ